MCSAGVAISLEPQGEVFPVVQEDTVAAFERVLKGEIRQLLPLGFIIGEEACNELLQCLIIGNFLHVNRGVDQISEEAK